jgi:hypothetical protein
MNFATNTTNFLGLGFGGFDFVATNNGVPPTIEAVHFD